MDHETAEAIAKKRWGKYGRAWKRLGLCDNPGYSPSQDVYFVVGIGLNVLGYSQDGFEDAFKSQASFGKESDEKLRLRLSLPDADFAYSIAVDRVRAALAEARKIVTSESDVVPVAALILSELKLNR